MMLDLDSNPALPGPILAEQLLQNAGISKDHQLLIRTALQQNLTFAKVAEELAAQHGSIHMDEQNYRNFSFFFFDSSALVDIICRRSQLPLRKTKAK